MDEGLPRIPNLEDLAGPDEVAAFLRMSKRSLMELRFIEPEVPYLRFGNAIYFSKTQVAWWLNEYQVWSKRRFDARRELMRQASLKTIANKRKGK